MSAKAMKLTREMMEKALLRKTFTWADGVLKELIPSEVYNKAHGTPDERMSAHGWLKERGYRIVSPGEGVVQVFRGTALIRQTKLVLELDKPEELLSIAEVVKDNANIPPPPWQPRNV